MFLNLPGSPWNPAQQPGLETCLKITVSNGVSGGTAPEAAVITAAIELAAAIRIAVAAREKGEGAAAASEAVSLCDRLFSAAIKVSAAIRIAVASSYCSGGACFYCFFHVFLCRG